MSIPKVIKLTIIFCLSDLTGKSCCYGRVWLTILMAVAVAVAVAVAGVVKSPHGAG